MNEQLVVKNFGPIKDATVDFKRVTVFIGPTGGGKSTLAKLRDIFLYNRNYKIGHDSAFGHPRFEKLTAYSEHSLGNYFSSDTFINFESDALTVEYSNGTHFITPQKAGISQPGRVESVTSLLMKAKTTEDFEVVRQTLLERIDEILNYKPTEEGIFSESNVPVAPWYCASERVFIPALEYSWAGLLRDDIGLPKLLLHFANSFSVFRKDIPELEIPFLKVKYLHIDGRDFIKVPEREEPLMLLETASGIQSVTPLLVLLEHLSRNTEQAQSFIIEEPELNLYPTAQQGLLNWLVEKCTKGENDLTITTHSPYILSSCNLLLEAYKVAQQRPELADEIDKIVPRACWLNPEEFAAYYVADGTVKPITDDRTHLIGSNELDAVSGDISDSFRQLLRLQKQKSASV
jgi:energy-coupling factor transporter ATP-binding protein EcfA2